MNKKKPKTRISGFCNLNDFFINSNHSIKTKESPENYNITILRDSQPIQRKDIEIYDIESKKVINKWKIFKHLIFYNSMLSKVDQAPFLTNLLSLKNFVSENSASSLELSSLGLSILRVYFLLLFSLKRMFSWLLKIYLMFLFKDTDFLWMGSSSLIPTVLILIGIIFLIGDTNPIFSSFSALKAFVLLAFVCAFSYWFRTGSFILFLDSAFSLFFFFLFQKSSRLFSSS